MERPLRFAALQLISTTWDLAEAVPGSILNLVSPWMDGKQMLPYMDTDGQDHVRG